LLADQQIDWTANPSDSREWLLMLHRHAWWALWGAAFQISGDEKYALAFVAQLNHWIDKNPMPHRKSEHIESWRLMETGLRMRVSWIPSFAAFSKAVAFDDRSKMKMLRSIYDHGQFLYHFHTNRNHLVRESNGLLATGLCFPEFLESTEWVEEGLRRLDAELRAQLNPDGSHIEMSVGYQWLTIDEFEVTRALLKKHDRNLPVADIDESLLQMYEFLAAVIRPDRSFPQLNDGFILWDSERLAAAARDFGREDLEYIASGGQSGVTSPFCSRSFANAGLHVMRSGWASESCYLIFDTGPYGGPHGHEDKLSFEVFANGAPFIVDSGSYTYESSDPFRKYFVGSQGHNTVLVDGGSQVRRWYPQHMTPAVDDTKHGIWRSDQDFDYAAGSYSEGYAEFDLAKPEHPVIDTDVTHHREVLFLKPDYWVIVDRLVAKKPHQYSFLFHLTPDVSVLSCDCKSAVVQSERNGTKLLIRALGAEATRSRVWSGSVDPIQGWFSQDHHSKVAAPALGFDFDNSTTMMVAWAIVPLLSDSDPATVQMNELPVAGSDAFAYSVQTQRCCDSLLVANKTDQRSFDGCESTSVFTVIRRRGDDQASNQIRFDR
jgi:heparinase II/III-like protein